MNRKYRHVLRAKRRECLSVINGKRKVRKEEVRLAVSQRLRSEEGTLPIQLFSSVRPNMPLYGVFSVKVRPLREK